MFEVRGKLQWELHTKMFHVGVHIFIASPAQADHDIIIFIKLQLIESC